MEGAGRVVVARLTLLEAIDQRRTLAVIRAAVRTRPGEIAEIDPEQNEYPLHRAIRLRLPPDVIKFLARHCPQALRHRAYSQGWLPLHLAAQQSPLGVVREVLEAWRGALDEKTTDKGYLPLHLAFGFSPDEMAVVRLLATEGPQAIRKVNGEGMLPLHIAAAFSTEEVVEFLTVEWDGALQRQTDMGYFPLHVAAGFRAKHGLDPTGMIRLLASKWPPALQATDKRGNLPMHVAAQVSTLPAVQVLAELSEQALQTRTNSGALAMHLAAYNVCDLEAQVVTYLSDRYSPALQARDVNGCLPIHYAASIHHKEAIQLFAKLSPEGLQQQSNKGCFPLQVAVYKGAPLDLVQSLLVAFPEAVQAKDRYGRTTLKLAETHKAPSDVVRFLANNGPSRWLVQFLEDDENPTLQLRVTQYFAKLATSRQRDGVVECGAIPHLVRLQSSPIYEIREQAVKALVAGAKASTRYREAFQEAQKARKLEVLQQRASNNLKAVPGGQATAAQRLADSISNVARSAPDGSSLLSHLPDEKERGNDSSALRAVPTNTETAIFRNMSPPRPPNRSKKVRWIFTWCLWVKKSRMQSDGPANAALTGIALVARSHFFFRFFVLHVDSRRRPCGYVWIC
jgi:ankyrin repeat protein